MKPRTGVVLVAMLYCIAIALFFYKTGMYVMLFTSEAERLAALQSLDIKKVSVTFTTPENALENIEKYREWAAGLDWRDSMAYQQWFDHFEEQALEQMEADRERSELPQVPVWDEEDVRS